MPSGTGNINKDAITGQLGGNSDAFKNSIGWQLRSNQKAIGRQK